MPLRDDLRRVVKVLGQRQTFAVDAHFGLPDALRRGGVPANGDALAEPELTARTRVVDPDARPGTGCGHVHAAGTAIAHRQHGDDGGGADHGDGGRDDEHAVHRPILDPVTWMCRLQFASWSSSALAPLSQSSGQVLSHSWSEYGPMTNEIDSSISDSNV